MAAETTIKHLTSAKPIRQASQKTPKTKKNNSGTLSIFEKMKILVYNNSVTRELFLQSDIVMQEAARYIYIFGMDVYDAMYYSRHGMDITDQEWYKEDMKNAYEAISIIQKYCKANDVNPYCEFKIGLKTPQEKENITYKAFCEYVDTTLVLQALTDEKDAVDNYVKDLERRYDPRKIPTESQIIRNHKKTKIPAK